MKNSRNDKFSTNFILDSLPQTDYEWLRPKLEEVDLQQGDVLFRAREPISAVYLPATCLLSWTSSTDLGEIVEIGVTGNEGMAGISLFLDEDLTPWQLEVEVSGKAFKLFSQDFRHALEISAVLRQKVAAFTYFKMVQLSQSALCNRYHSIEQRLCRWLLSAQDHSKTSEISLTREILAHMIGAGRPTVSIVTGTLQTAGLIHSNRGKITILNRQRMEEVACECYQVVKEALV